MENVLIDGEPITALNEYKAFKNADRVEYFFFYYYNMKN